MLGKVQVNSLNKRSSTAMSEIAAGVFGFDVSLEFLRLRKIFATDVALRAATVGIGRAAVRPMNVQISRSQETLQRINTQPLVLGSYKRYDSPKGSNNFMMGHMSKWPNKNGRVMYLVAEIANVFAALVVIAGSGSVGQTIVVFLVDHIVVVIVVRRVTGVLLLLVANRRTVPIAVVSGESGCSCDCGGGSRGNSIRVMVIVAVVMRMLFVLFLIFFVVVHSDGCRSSSGRCCSSSSSSRFFHFEFLVRMSGRASIVVVFFGFVVGSTASRGR